jgi:hypothetical protein
MNKKVYRYFGLFLKTQKKWLNKMADRGYRLVRTTRLMYEFEESLPAEYEYQVEFVADKSNRKARDYQNYLEELGYRTFTKNININYSYGKIEWRPWAKGAGQISTSPGSYNKELLIVEKKRDGKRFELYTDLQDIINYYQNVRRIYCSWFLTGIVLLAANLIKLIRIDSIFNIIAAIIAITGIIPAIYYTVLIHHQKTESKTNE